MRDEVNRKQQDYIKYVIEELIDDTFVDVRDQKIWHPYDSYYSRHLIGGAPGGFVDFVEDKFGVLRSEVDLVWSHYKNKIKDENGWVQIVPFDDTLDAIRFAMRESRKHNKGNEEFKRIDNPKQHKFYNSIADKVVSLIKVRDESWGKDIFLTDLLDPDFPGQGASLVAPINIPDYETFQKRMMTIIQDFFPMLEKYWYVEEFFDQIFILTRFVFPKIWNKFYKGEDQPEESTEYGDHALDYDEKMGKEKITGGSKTSWDDISNNESINNKLFNIIENRTRTIDEDNRDFKDVVLKDMINQSTISKSEFGIYTLVLPSGNHIFNFDLWKTETPPGYLYCYMRDTYGMIEEEIKQVWLRYKDIMLERIKKLDDDDDTFRVNESTKPLPDSIFQMIQDDLFERTVKIPRTNYPLCTGGENLNDYRVNDEENNAIFPFDKPNFVIQINLPSSPYPYNVEMGRGRSWGQLNDYLTQQYGLTQEECEIVWDEYRGTICKNAKLPSLNESRDKQQELIQYVITTLLKETIIDKENSEVILPWNMKYVNIMANLAGIDKDLHNAALELNGSMAYNFWEMMETIYGLTDDEVERVWKIYGPTLSQRMHDAWFDDWKTQYYDGAILDEAEAKIITHPEDDEDPYSFAWHPEPKKRKFYEAVLRDVVSASIIGWDSVITIGDSSTIPGKRLDFHNLSHAYDTSPFLQHLKDTYGLLDNETHPIWSRWEHIMIDKMKKWLKSKDISFNDAGYDVGVDYTDEHIWDGNEEINESEEDDKIIYTTDKKTAKQQKVLDYAIEDLTNNTLLDWGSDTQEPYQIIRFPFSIYPHKDPTKDRLEWIMIGRNYDFNITQFYQQFKPYARTMYGLTDVELLKVFGDWEGEVIEKIRDHSETDPPRA